MSLLLDTQLASFFLRYSFLFDDQLFHFLINRRFCLSNLGQIFIPQKLMLTPAWMSVGLKTSPKRFTYWLAVNRKKYRIDNLVIWESLPCSQVNGEKITPTSSGISFLF